MSLDRLNAIQLLRLYGRQYASLKDSRLDAVDKKEVWSSHFYKQKQVFWVYHWFVREDGAAERLLKDGCIGWQAGNWEVNKRSIAICVDDDPRNKQVNSAVLQKIAEIIKQNYSFVIPKNIIGHCDVNPKTECPGYLFNQKWRDALLKLV